MRASLFNIVLPPPPPTHTHVANTQTRPEAKPHSQGHVPWRSGLLVRPSDRDLHPLCALPFDPPSAPLPHCPSGKLIPLDELYHLDPWWRSIFDHDVTVQFHHRMNAYATLALVAALSLLHARAPAPLQVTRALRLVQGVVVLQVALGITTVLNGAPIHLASAHQGGAVLLLTYVLVLVFMLRTAPPAWVMHAVKA